MAKFQIMTPGGYEVEVTADTQEAAIAKARESWQTLPRIIAKSGSTRVFDRDGKRYVVSPGFSTSDPELVQQVLDRIQAGSETAAGDVSRQSIDEGLIAQYPATARASQFVRGVPFAGSRADELVGAIAGEDAATGTRALQGAMQRQRPGETLGLNLAGAGAAAGGAAMAAPRALSALTSGVVGAGPRGTQMLRGLGAGGLLGAAEGAVYGSGEGTTPEDRAANAQTGGVVGGLVGGAAGAAGPVVRDVAENVIGRFRRSDIRQIASTLGISQDAAKVIKNAFDMGDDIDGAIARLRTAGDNGMIGDAGEAAQSLLDATAASGPSGSAAVRGPLEARATQSAADLNQGLTGLLGQPTAGPRTAVANIQQATGPARRQAYDAAFSTPIDYATTQGRAIEGVLDRVDSNTLLRAVQEANEEMQSRGIANQQIMAMIDNAGNVTFREMPNVQQLDQIKRALDAAARSARDPRTGLDTQQSMRFSRLASELRDSIVEATGGQSGPYSQALNIGGDTIQERQAYLLGESLLSPRTRLEDVTIELGSNPSQAQLDAVRSGLRTRVDEIVGNVRRIASDPNIDARQMLATLREMGSDNARAKIRAIMGDQADDLIRMLDEASVAAETRAATSANSRTATRQATQQGVEDITAPGVVGQAAQGDPINASREIVRAITGMTQEYTQQQRQALYRDVAKALTEKRGPEARAALGVIKRAMEGQTLTEAQTRDLANLLATALYGAGTPAMTRSATEGMQR